MKRGGGGIRWWGGERGEGNATSGTQGNTGRLELDWSYWLTGAQCYLPTVQLELLVRASSSGIPSVRQMSTQSKTDFF